MSVRLLGLILLGLSALGLASASRRWPHWLKGYRGFLWTLLVPCALWENAHPASFAQMSPPRYWLFASVLALFYADLLCGAWLWCGRVRQRIRQRLRQRRGQKALTQRP